MAKTRGGVRRPVAVAPRRNEAGEATRARIRSVAEDLFAERGIDAVSIRDITSAAEVDVSAIHYHFGSKHDLALAILHARAEQLGALRSALLDQIEADPDPTLASVVEALVQPSLTMSRGFGAPEGAPIGTSSYLRFLNAALAHPDIAPEVAGAFDGHTVRYLAALERVTPDLSPEVRAVRYVFAKTLINAVLGSPTEHREAWVAAHAPGPTPDLVEELVATVTASFRPAPPG